MLDRGQNVPLGEARFEIAMEGGRDLGPLFGLCVVPEGGAPPWLSQQDGFGPLVQPTETGVLVDLGALPSSCGRVWVGLYALRAASTFREALPARFRVAGHELVAGPDERGCAALFFAEIYRRGGAFKLRSVFEGVTAGGIEELGRRFGIAIADNSPPVLAGGAPGGGPRGPQASDAERWTGSGFFVSPGFAVTNAHVVRDAGTLRCIFEGENRPVSVLVRDDESDLAVLRLEGRAPAEFLKFRPARGVELGEEILTLGFPLAGLLASGPQVTNGGVSALLGPGDDARVFQITAPIQPGSSGGPVLDRAGRIAGVSVASLSSGQNVNFAVRSSLASALCEASGIDIAFQSDEHVRSVSEIARAARRAVVKMECRR